ncbi:MAG: hypothetical protein LBT03_01985 [Holosporales bacterium]|nr:hypothetical protein [Holosporales bacterium]
MKKFVVVGLFALFGGATSGTCTYNENGLRKIVVDLGEFQALYNVTCSPLWKLVEIYETGNVKVGNPDVMDEVDGMIRELDGFITPQKICKSLDFSSAVEVYLCSDLNGYDTEDEQKIGQEIIQRWKDLGFSSKTRNP